MMSRLVAKNSMYYLNPEFLNAQQQQRVPSNYELALQAYSMIPRCLHVDCPVCKKQREEIEALGKLEEEIKICEDETKELLKAKYKSRCAKFMKWYRSKYKRKK
jgi:hypothetical protein